MSHVATRTERTVFFGEKLKDADLRVLLKTLQFSATRAGRRIVIRRHIPGRFIEFAGNGLEGSIVVSPVPLSEAIWTAQAETREGAAGAAIERSLRAHRAHMHLSLEGKADLSTAARMIARATFGCFAAADPLAMWDQEEGAALSKAEARNLLGVKGRILHPIATAISADDTDAERSSQDIRIRRVDPATRTQRRSRPRLGARPATRQPKTLWETLRDANFSTPTTATLGRISAGVILGMMISGYVQTAIFTSATAAPKLVGTAQLMQAEPGIRAQ